MIDRDKFNHLRIINPQTARSWIPLRAVKLTAYPRVCTELLFIQPPTRFELEVTFATKFIKKYKTSRNKLEFFGIDEESTIHCKTLKSLQLSIEHARVKIPERKYKRYFTIIKFLVERDVRVQSKETV